MALSFVATSMYSVRLLSVVLLLLIMGPSVAKKKTTNYHTKQARQNQMECARTVCKDVHYDENDDCVDRCSSPKCYTDIFGENPLEPGEVDKERRNRFNVCTKKEKEEERRNKNSQKQGECARTVCNDIHEDENDDCVDRCVSPSCYEEIFAKDPLEPGEVDRERRSRFNACTR